MQHQLAPFERATVHHLINSYFDRPPDLDLPWHIAESPSSSGDFPLVERLLGAFSKAHEVERLRSDVPNQGVWEMVKHEFHGPAYQALLKGDVRGLAQLLSNALRTRWTYGLGLSEIVFSATKEPGPGRLANVLILKDRLVTLAVALGALPQENPEQGRYGENIHTPIDQLLLSIESAAKTEMSRPAVMGIFGLQTSTGVVDFRAPEDVLAADRLASLSSSGSIAEIGGGYGGVALQCVRKGLRTTIFDLPVIGVLQGYFLGKTLGPDKVQLYGENTVDCAVKVLPWWLFGDRDRAFDAVFNRDSMAEFPDAAARSYLREMKARRAAYLSINQEVEGESGQPGVRQLSVSKVAASEGLRRMSRFPYWIRRGYVEELFTA